MEYFQAAGKVANNDQHAKLYTGSAGSLLYQGTRTSRVQRLGRRADELLRISSDMSRPVQSLCTPVSKSGLASIAHGSVRSNKFPFGNIN